MRFIKFNPQIHTLEYIRIEWEVSVNTLLYQRMYEIGLKEEDLAHALWVALETCPYCNDADRGCQCENDE